MKITEALELEIKAIQTKHSDLKIYDRDDVVQVIIGIKFSDENTHWIIPDQPTTQAMSKILSRVSQKDARWEEYTVVGSECWEPKSIAKIYPRNKTIVQKILGYFNLNNKK